MNRSKFRLIGTRPVALVAAGCATLVALQFPVLGLAVVAGLVVLCADLGSI